jgi:hypothetical protein
MIPLESWCNFKRHIMQIMGALRIMDFVMNALLATKSLFSVALVVIIKMVLLNGKSKS